MSAAFHTGLLWSVKYWKFGIFLMIKMPSSHSNLVESQYNKSWAIEFHSPCTVILWEQLKPSDEKMGTYWWFSDVNL